MLGEDDRMRHFLNIVIPTFGCLQIPTPLWELVQGERGSATERAIDSKQKTEK